MEVSARSLAGSAFCIVLAASLLVLSGPSFELNTFADVPFEDIEQVAGGSGPAFRDNLVIRNEVTWEAVWLETHSGETPLPTLPTVNFTSEIVIVVSQGARSSGGFFTNITRIIIAGGFYVVYVDEIHPGPDCGVITVITYPHHIVKISGFPLSLPVQFVYNITERIC